MSTLTWSAGAVTGFVVQPLVGTFSDRCESKYGRRRPFLVAGVIATVFSQLLFSWSSWLGERFGDSGDDHSKAIITALVAVWVLGAAINIVQTPLRAIVADVAAEEQQELGQSLASAWQACGAIVGFMVGFVWDPLSIMREYFGASAACLVLTTAIACCISSEKRHVNEERSSGCGEIRVVFKSIVSGLFAMPSGMRRICVVQFCTWAAWFMFNPNWPAWMGSYVYGGDVSAPAGSILRERYARGSEAGSLAQAMAAGVQAAFSFVVPPIVRCLGLRPVYVLCFVVFSGTLIGMGMLPPTPDVHTNYYAVILIAATGIPLAATNIFPFSIIGRDFGTDPNLALFMGSLNIFIVLPQLADVAYAGKVAEIAGWNTVMLVGGGWAALATLSIFFLKFSDATPGHRRGTFRDAKRSNDYQSDAVERLQAYTKSQEA